MHPLGESNFLLLAAKAYSNPSCSDISEFYEDLEKIKHIKKLINRYQRSGKLNIRLLVNHFIGLYNVFEPRTLTMMLCYRLDDELSYVKPILEYLGYWPEIIGPFASKDKYISGKMINSDESILQELRTL